MLARLINADADGARIVPAFRVAIAETRDRAIETLRAGLETETPRLWDKSAKQCRNRGSGDGGDRGTSTTPSTHTHRQNTIYIIYILDFRARTVI